MQSALAGLAVTTQFVRVLGCYPRLSVADLRYNQAFMQRTFAIIKPDAVRNACDRRDPGPHRDRRVHRRRHAA